MLPYILPHDWSVQSYNGAVVTCFSSVYCVRLLTAASIYNGLSHLLPVAWPQAVDSWAPTPESRTTSSVL